MANQFYYSATIANGATTSDVIDCTNGTICGFILPAAFTGTAVTFTVCDEPNGTFQTLYDSTNATVGATVTQGRSYKLNPADFVGYRFVKIVSGSSEGAARTIKIAQRQFI